MQHRQSKLKRRRDSEDGLERLAAANENAPASLCEALDRALHKGVCVRGDVTISVEGVDLVYIGLSSLIASIDTAQRAFEHAAEVRHDRL